MDLVAYEKLLLYIVIIKWVLYEIIHIFYNILYYKFIE